MEALFVVAAVAAVLLVSLWFDRYSHARLREAIRYWQRSATLWRMIAAAPIDHLSDEELEAYAKALEDAVAEREAVR